MFQALQSWLDERGAQGLGGGLLLAGLLAVGLHALQQSRLGEVLDQNLVQVLEFRLRSAAGFGPELDPRLKIHRVDSRTDLEPEWNADVQVFFTEKSAEPLDLGLPLWARNRWIPAGLELAWLPVNDQAAHGTEPRDPKNFSTPGHAHSEAGGNIPLFLRPAPHLLIPHASLQFADQVAISAQGVSINGERMTSRTATVLVNYLEPSSLRSASIRREETISAADSIVLIVDDGSSDRVSSPFGEIPRGELMVAMVNSVLTGRWIQTIEPSLPKILLGTVLGVLVGLFLELWLLACAAALGLLGISGLGLALFIFADIRLHWLWPGLGFMLMTLGCLAWKRYRRPQDF